MLQSESEKPHAFDEWYLEKRNEMKAYELLRRFVEARNLIVKQTSLTSRSKALSGLFRGRGLKLAIQHDIPVFLDTRSTLERAKQFAIGFFLDEEHSAIGEQIGVERTWIVEELGDSEITALCVEALNYMGHLVAEVHKLYGMDARHDEIEFNMPSVQVLLESDVDPSLPDKWGW